MTQSTGDLTQTGSITSQTRGYSKSHSLRIADKIDHDGDTDTYMQFGNNQWNVYVGGSREITVDTTGVRLGDTGNGYFQPVSGNYGSIQIDGGAHGGWEGYSIGGRMVFMHDNSNAVGIYNDVDNEWMFRAQRNAESRMYHNGTEAFRTRGSNAVQIGVASSTSSDIFMSDNDNGERRIHCNSNYIGFLNSSNGWSARSADNGKWEMVQGASVSGGTLDMNNNDIVGVDQIVHEGDSNTYIQFHAADQFRVVTGGTERLEVNNSRTQIDTLLVTGTATFQGSVVGVDASARNCYFWENDQTITSNQTITNNKNAMSAGPITINNGVTVTIGDGEAWSIV